MGVRISPNGVFNDMGSPNFREQFMHVATMLDRFRLGYLHVVDGPAFGFHTLGEPMMLAGGMADLVAFGRPFISNPDLVERFRHGWPLAAPAEMTDWYSPTGAKGYTDFPAHRS